MASSRVTDGQTIASTLCYVHTCNYCIYCCTWVVNVVFKIVISSVRFFFFLSYTDFYRAVFLRLHFFFHLFHFLFFLDAGWLMYTVQGWCVPLYSVSMLCMCHDITPLKLINLKSIWTVVVVYIKFPLKTSRKWVFLEG